MRVCVVAHIFPARSETFVLEHVLGLARKGCQVTVISKHPDTAVSASELARIDAEGIRRVYVGDFTSFSTKVGYGLNALRAVRAVMRNPALHRAFLSKSPWTLREILIAHAAVRYIRANEFDLVHVHFGDLAARLQFVSSKVKSFPPIVVTWHGSDANAIPRKLGKDVFADLFASKARHTVGTQFILDRLVGLGADPRSLTKIPMGIDVGRFSYRERTLKEGDSFRILSVGRLDEVKGHRYLIDAVAALRRKGLDISLRIGGDGPLHAALASQIQDLGVGDRVELIGSIDSDTVVHEMHSAHLFALTGVETKSGKVENQGVVLQEAQATGLPVVSSRAGGVPESVLDGVTGVLCEPGDVDAISHAIEGFSANKKLLSDYGRSARESVEQNFSNEVMLSRIHELYESVCFDLLK